MRVYLGRCAGSEVVLQEVASRVLTTPTPDPASQTLSRHAHTHTESIIRCLSRQSGDG